MMPQQPGPMGVPSWNAIPSLQNVSPNIMTPNMQQPPQPVRVNLPIYFVNSANDIRPADVSQDGSINLFISRDLKTIYARSLNPDITISAADYVLKQPETQTPQVAVQPVQTATDKTVNDILERFDTLTERMSALEEKLSKKNNYHNNNPKKGEQTNGQ